MNDADRDAAALIAASTEDEYSVEGATRVINLLQEIYPDDPEQAVHALLTALRGITVMLFRADRSE